MHEDEKKVRASWGRVHTYGHNGTEWGADVEQMLVEKNKCYLTAFNSLQVVRSELAEANAELLALRWRPITPECLPKVGDEVWGERMGIMAVPFTTKDAFTDKEWALAGWTRFRPLGVPSPKEQS